MAERKALSKRVRRLPVGGLRETPKARRVAGGLLVIDLDDVLTLDSWVTADQHWEHPRIREYQGRPADHFEVMRERWLDRVAPDDVLLHLGDVVCFGDRERHPFWLDGLPGRKYLLRGNHDEHSDDWYRAAGFEVLGRGNRPYTWVVPDWCIAAFSHEPITQDRFGYSDPDWDVNVHGHIHANELWDPLPGKEYRNACVEVTDYAPVRLRDILS